jgi:hypothetical protein
MIGHDVVSKAEVPYYYRQIGLVYTYKHFPLRNAR